MARPTKQTPTLTRKIHFYLASQGTEGGKPKSVDIRGCLKKIEALEDDDWYMADLDGNVTCCWVDSLGSRPRVRLAAVRRSGLPQLEQKRALRGLSIPSDSGLAEQIHVVLFPDDIVGAEFNFYGPRLPRLGRYLDEKVNCENLSFHGLLRQDVIDQLNALEAVRLIQLQVHKNYASTVETASHDLGAAMRGALEVTGAEEVEITLKPARHSRSFLSDDVLPLVKRLARRNDLREGAGRFTVRGMNGETGQMQTIDVLKDLLVAEKEVKVVGDRLRAVQSDAMYTAIEAAYEEMHKDLRKAAHLG